MKQRRLWRRFVAIAVLTFTPLVTAMTVAPAYAACGQTVTNTNDTGAGSLRAAIAAGGGQTVCFNISGSGTQVIGISSQLNLGQSITIDGTTQPGYAGVPLIELDGVNAGGAVGLNLTGGTTTIKGLSVVRFGGDGIIMANNGSNTIQANYVGISPSGVAMGNGHSGIGILNSASNTIGGTTPAARNVVSGNGGTGIALTDTSGSAGSNVVEGNYIGTNPAGAAAVGNGADGVLLNNAPNNTIGGTTSVTVGGDCTGACNLSSGNVSNGIGIEGATATGNTVAGNYAGTDFHGTSAVPNGDIGFESQSPNNTIGGTTAASRNIFSGNLGAGVSLTTTTATGNVVEGNYIGVDVSGNTGMGNHKMGVNLGSPDGSSNNASSNTIGGTTGTTAGGSCTGACNVISGNSWSGIYISGATGGANNIVGNFIGPGASGGITVGNVQDGVGIVDSPNNHFGGPVTAARNLISGNGSSGFAIVGTGPTGTRIEGNYIGEGTDAGCMPNHSSGVVDQNALDVAIIGNNIFCSGQWGIDLANNGVTFNDTGDGDSGANELQNYPVLSYAIPSGSNVLIAGSLNSNPNTSYRLDFFTSPYCDASGHGQGQMNIGNGNVTTDGNGNVSFSFTLPGVGQGLSVTSTATKIISGTPWETSEFSTCVFTPHQHPDGAIIQPQNSPNLFQVVGGQVQPIGSVGVLNSWNISSSEFKTATTGDTNLTGTSPLFFREGTLLRGSTPDVYVVDQTSPGVFAKRRITNITAFNGLGYTGGDIINVIDAVLPATNGSDITDATQHPDGALVKDPNGATVYLIDSGQKRLVGSPAVFVSQRYKSSQIKTATATDLGLASGSNVYFREGTLLRGSTPNVYVVDDTGSGFAKRRIGSVQVFIELQYNSSEILNVSDPELPATDGPQI